jgi:hypothetical protein
MSELTALSRQFDDAAQLYDEVRPRYPVEIIEHILAFAAISRWKPKSISTDTRYAPAGSLLVCTKSDTLGHDGARARNT